ncbi:copia protein [Tanacetum coccineum]
MELEPEVKVPGLECNRSLPEGVPFVNYMVIEEPKYRIFFIDVFGVQAFQRWDDIHKVGIDSLFFLFLIILAMASMVKDERECTFSLKLRKDVVETRPRQAKIQESKASSIGITHPILGHKPDWGLHTVKGCYNTSNQCRATKRVNLGEGDKAHSESEDEGLIISPNDVFEDDDDHNEAFLGRPWKSDLNVVYKGKDNTYTFSKGGHKFTLCPYSDEVQATTTKVKNQIMLCSTRNKEKNICATTIPLDQLDFIRETILVPVNKETISVRVFETDEDVDSLFNGYLFDSSSDEEEDFTCDSNDGDNEDHREVNNGNHHGDDDPHENDGDKKDPWYVDNDHHHRADEHEADDDHQHGNEEHGDNRDLGDFSGEESHVGINSNESRDFNTNMEKNFGYHFSALHAEVQIEEESTSVVVHGVNDIRTNKPTADKVDCDSKVTSTQPLICPTPPLSLSVRSRSNTHSSKSNRSHSVPTTKVSSKNINNTRKKRFASLRLIDPLNGVRGCVTQPKKNRHNCKNITHPVQDDVPSCGSENISDSLSKIERCNNRIKSNADHDTDSDSNEVVRISYLNWRELPSMARKIYLRGGLGVGSFQRSYGGSKRNGSAPPHFCKASGGIARHILQQLQSMNIVDFHSKG